MSGYGADAAASRWEISSDLVFSVTTPGREPVQGRVSASGPTVTVATDDPVAVWEAATGGAAAGDALLRVVAGQLHEQGITLAVSGPGGTVATVGAGVDSSLGRLATGSRHVRLGRPAAVAPLARARALSLVQAHRSEVYAGAAALATLAALALWRRASLGA